MRHLTLFCHPGSTYQGMAEEKAAELYTDMAVRDFDHFIILASGFESLVDDPTYEAVVNHKEGRAVKFTLFHQLPLWQIGRASVKCDVSSYLFNPAPSAEFQKRSGNLVLPDLDVVVIEAQADAARMGAEEIRRFYEMYGWTVGAYERKIQETACVEPTSKRFPAGYKLEIIDPAALLNMAQRLAGYNPDKLYFGNKGEKWL